MDDLTRNWVGKYYRGLSFLLNKATFDNPVRLGMLDLFQIGEIGLNDGGKVLEHSQVCSEISYVVSGEGYFTVNGVKSKVKKGDIHIVGINDKHEIEAEKYTNFRYAYIGFKLRKDIDLNRYASLVEFYENPPVMPIKDNKNIHYSFDVMMDELYTEHEYSTDVFDASATQLIIQCFKLYENKSNKYYVPEYSKKIVGEIAYDIMRYIDSQIPDIKNVSDIAVRLGYTPDYLTKLFKSKTGISIQKYIQDKRIDYSIELLKSGKYSVKDIAATLNYESTQSFSKMFKKNTGYTPSEYIRNPVEQ